MSRITRVAHSIVKDRETSGSGENLGKLKDDALLHSEILGTMY
jgi:hypothetical protein